MLRYGTTLVEAKSGYGLECETEMRMLEVIESARAKHAMETVSTFLVHSIPEGWTAEAYTEDVLRVQLPELQRRVQQGSLHVDLVDIFNEIGYFEYPHAKKILAAARSAGFNLNFHGDEMKDSSSALLATELGALAVSHLESVSTDGLKALAQNKGVIALLLPTTSYILNAELKYARAGEMIDMDIHFSFLSFLPHSIMMDPSPP